jgi:hypothetical protein
VGTIIVKSDRVPSLSVSFFLAQNAFILLESTSAFLALSVFT